MPTKSRKIKEVAMLDHRRSTVAHCMWSPNPQAVNIQQIEMVQHIELLDGSPHKSVTNMLSQLQWWSLQKDRCQATNVLWDFS
jgi:hypothetical protein